MIRIESVRIEEVRGVRNLKLDFDRKNFSICGPNGSGKSGVVDAIEFALTGEITRLTGSGTKGLSVLSHGPHVDKRDFPDVSSVELRLHIPVLGKSATITRKIKSPKKPTIVPADDDVVAVLAEVADHPEVTLSRREIIRFTITEPSKRSEEVQALLKVALYAQGKEYTNLPFGTPSLYKYVRHPLCIGWFVVFWATPTMSMGHLLFAAVATAYILVAVQIEEHDLLDYFGDDYVRYRREVAMFIPLPGRRSRSA